MQAGSQELRTYRLGSSGKRQRTFRQLCPLQITSDTHALEKKLLEEKKQKVYFSSETRCYGRDSKEAVRESSTLPER